MKNITIGRNIEDKREAIEQALAEIQKRCTARTVDFDTVKKAIKTASDSCPIQVKAHRAGIRFSIDPNGQKFPNAYTNKGRPQSTVITGEFTKSGVKIEFKRDDTHGADGPAYSGYNKEQALMVLMQAGCYTEGLRKAINLYENQTGKNVTF